MEPLHILSNEEKSDDDTAESDNDAKNRKRKRVLASKGLHFVPANDPRQTGEKESKSKEQSIHKLAQEKNVVEKSKDEPLKSREKPILKRVLPETLLQVETVNARQLHQEELTPRPDKPEPTAPKQSDFERRAAETFDATMMQPVEALKQSPVDANRIHSYSSDNRAAELAGPKNPANETLFKKPPESLIPAKTEMLPRQLTEKQVQTLSRTELLALSESISVEGSTLKQIYETHLIGERGLRRLVAEHLRGGDIRRLIRSEIVDHEIDFERDPALRSAVPVPANGGSSTTDDPKSTLDKMVEKAASNLGGSENEAAVYKAEAEQEAESIGQANRSRSWIDGLLAALIVAVLIAVALLLYARR